MNSKQGDINKLCSACKECCKQLDTVKIIKCPNYKPKGVPKNEKENNTRKG
jgi:hypothetical protein